MKAPGGDLVPSGLTAPQKAAVIVSLLGREAAKPLLQRFAGAELREFARTLAGLGNITEVQIAAVVEEFRHAVTRRGVSLQGGAEQALDILGDHLSTEEMSRLRFDLDSASGAGAWARIATIPAPDLAQALAAEQPKVAAIVLARVPPELSAAMVAEMPPERAREVIAAIAQVSATPPKVADQIARSLAERFSGDVVRPAIAGGPAGKVAEILSVAASPMRDAVLAHLQALFPEFQAEVRGLMFTFADIPARIDKRDIAKIARAADQGTLLKALAGAAETAPEVREMILSNLSTRLAEQMTEAIADLGSVKVQDADAAQTEIVKVIRSLEAGGEITLIVPGS